MTILKIWVPGYTALGIVYIFICMILVNFVSEQFVKPINDLTERIQHSRRGIQKLRKKMRKSELNMSE